MLRLPRSRMIPAANHVATPEMAVAQREYIVRRADLFFPGDRAPSFHRKVGWRAIVFKREMSRINDLVEAFGPSGGAEEFQRVALSDVKRDARAVLALQLARDAAQ